METEEETLKRLKEYLQEEEQARKKCAELAQQSFESWSENNISVIGRACGYLITIPKRKIGEIWKWLIS